MDRQPLVLPGLPEPTLLSEKPVAKNNQKKEKALRNRENARKFKKKSPSNRRQDSRPAPAAKAK
jgi:hypothetical protein